MEVKNSKNWCLYSKRFAYTTSFLIFLLTTALLYTCGQNFYSAHPYKFYFLFGTLLAYYFGFWPAFIFMMIGTLYANYYFVAPFSELIFSFHDLQQYLLNLVLGLTCIVLIEILQRERFKSKLLLMVSESRYLILLHRDNRLLNEVKRRK